MFDWQALLRRPRNATGAELDAWFTRIAERLLNHTRLIVAGQPHRLVEVEAYFNSKDHPDPFSHCHPVQRHAGRWYFHRVGDGYRGGTHKGIDLAFGDARSHAGILIRAIETPGGHLIDGPSLCVDHLLKLTRCKTVGDLDKRIAGRLAWDAASPLILTPDKTLPIRDVCRSARVGLSLKRATQDSLHQEFVDLPFRFLTEPRRIRKGKRQLALGLYAAGKSAHEIRALTGSPMASIHRWLKTKTRRQR